MARIGMSKQRGLQGRKEKGFQCGPLANLYKGLILKRYLRAVIQKDMCNCLAIVDVPSCGCSDRPYARGDDENVNRLGQRPVREMN